MKNNVHENSLFANQKTDKVKNKERIRLAISYGIRTVSSLEHYTGIPLVTLRARLSDLKRENKIIPVGKIRNGNGNKEDYYRLAKPGERNKRQMTPGEKNRFILALCNDHKKSRESNPNQVINEIIFTLTS